MRLSNISNYQVLINIFLHKMDGKMTKLISVVVTCYNHENYIEQCLRSIFNQTYRNIELIVLDDGSTDSSSEIIQEVLKESPFVTTFESHENIGVVRTRNKGINLLNGDYFIFVDSDDFLDDRYVEELYDCAINHQADIVYCDLFNFEKNEVYLKAQEFELHSLLVSNYISNCSLVKKAILKDTYYDEKLSGKKLEDYDFFLNLIINNGAKAVYQPNTKLNYRVFEKDSIS